MGAGVEYTDKMWLKLRRIVHIIYSPLSFFIKVTKRSHYVSIVCSSRSCKTIPRLTHFPKSFKNKISPSFRTCRGSALLSVQCAPRVHLHTGSCHCFFRRAPLGGERPEDFWVRWWAGSLPGTNPLSQEPGGSAAESPGLAGG